MDAWHNLIWSFLGTGLAISLGLGAVKVLSGWFVEHRLKLALQEHQQAFDEKLKHFEAELGRASDLLSRRNEREFAVVENAWEAMIRAVGAAESNYLYDEDENLLNYDEEDTAAILESYAWMSPMTRQSLMNHPRSQRQHLFELTVDAHRLNETEQAWKEFKNTLTAKQIFMAPAIYEQFLEIAHELSDHTLAPMRAKAETRHIPTDVVETMKRSLTSVIAGMIVRLGATIQSRFGF